MKRKSLFSLAASMLLLVACDNQDNEMDLSGSEIKFASGIQVTVTRANNADVPHRQIAEGQKVGFFVKGAVETDQVNYANVYASANGEGAFNNFSEVMYYPQNDHILTVTAYHPYNAGTEETYDFTVNGDQSVDANYYASDLLYAGAKNITSQNTVVMLPFVHKLCNVRCTIDESLAGSKIEVLNVYTRVAFNRSTGETITQTADALSPVTLHAVYGAVLPAQTFTAGTEFLRVTVDGVPYIYTLKKEDKVVAEGGFQAGKVYKYRLSLKKTGLVVTSSVEDWNHTSEEEVDAGLSIIMG